jgi:hypothetical protein
VLGAKEVVAGTTAGGLSSDENKAASELINGVI